MIQGKRVLLTGGAGFIGSALAGRLINDNEIVVLDNGQRDALASTELMRHHNMCFVRGDVLDPKAVEEAMRGCSIVVHLAAIAGVDTVLRMPVTTMRVNML